MDIDKLRSQTKEVAPPPQRGAPGWLMPAVGLLAVLALLAAGVVLFLTRQAIVSTAAHDVGSSWVTTHTVVHSKLGEELTIGFMPVGDVNDTEAELVYSLTGDKASGKVELQMAVQNDEWVVVHAVLESPEGRLVIKEQREDDLGPDPQSQHHVVRGAQLLNAGRTSEALKEFDKAVISDAYNPEAYSWRGRAWLESGSPDKARTDFNKAVELDADLADAHQGLALSYVLEEDYAAAMPHLDQWVTKAPADGQAWQERGYAAFKLDKPEQALADATRACELGFEPGCVALEKLGGTLPAPQNPVQEAPPQ